MNISRIIGILMLTLGLGISFTKSMSTQRLQKKLNQAQIEGVAEYYELAQTARQERGR
ncbi:MAG: hypothetical protein AB1540_15920 [Bdellovibrionota bacterium]